MSTMVSPDAVHGLIYPQGLLDSLPVIQPSDTMFSEPLPNDGSKHPRRNCIGRLSATQFSTLHQRHILSHPPDGILFPFLHGLEGNNPAQNHFFVGPPSATRGEGVDNDRRNVIPVPRYRGLMWVICEDDLDSPSQLGLFAKTSAYDNYPPSDSLSSYSDDFDYDDEDYDFDDEDDRMDDSSSESFDDATFNMEVDMDVDIAVSDNANAADTGISPLANAAKSDDDEKHMHPVAHRPAMKSSIHTHDLHTPSDSSFTDELSSMDNNTLSDFTPLSSGDGTPPTSLESISSKDFKSKSRPDKQSKTNESITRRKTRKPRSSSVPLLTSTFRERDLIQGVQSDNMQESEEEWEFKTLHVPDGISLRNFGIQVPILATLSDIVVYSPKGCSPNAIKLAKRFRSAMQRKLNERLSVHSRDDLLTYNVFVLDCQADELVREIDHLIVRMSDSGFSTMERSGVDHLKHHSGADTGFEMGMDLDTGASRFNPSQGMAIFNTVDFAQRERDEMRDLTKASEIISIFPSDSQQPPSMNISTTSKHFDPCVGQVFLGNSNDVPLPPPHEEFNWTTALQSGSTLLNGSHFDSGYDNTIIMSASPTSSSEGEVVEITMKGENDAPVPSNRTTHPLPPLPKSHPLNHLETNSPADGLGYDICIECHDLAPFPTISSLRLAEDRITMLENMWHDHQKQMSGQRDDESFVPSPRPPPHANSIIHLPFPSSPSSTSATISALTPFIRFLERCLVLPPSDTSSETTSIPENKNKAPTSGSSNGRRWSSVSALIPSLPGFPLGQASQSQTVSAAAARNRAFTTSASTPPQSTLLSSKSAQKWSRPLKILLYSSDGYTESSVPALCLLMAVKELSLPEAYLELQVVKRRSFFVYNGDLGVLRRVEGRLIDERCERENQRQAVSHRDRPPYEHSSKMIPVQQAHLQQQYSYGRPSAKSVSFAQSPFNSTGSVLNTPPMPMSMSSQNRYAPHPSAMLPSMPTSSSVPRSSTAFPTSQSQGITAVPISGRVKRPRASTSPWLPSLFGGDHQAWFNDPRFDGSFPSRVLPFLYLGNLAHASNAYMLHALGITHVVSVGECALIPPSNMAAAADNADCMGCNNGGACHAHFVAGRGPGNQGSLWIEERAGRIKVLDIQGVCDDGIDTLEPQLEPICDWIDQARREGGQVLVHCRVGVSRSATVTIAYVMKHLNISLVDAYLIVRSRRLSVLIQPNMRLLYNLCGWEIKLAKERAQGDSNRLRYELSSVVSWPYLAKEVHKLNEKYLH